MFNIHFFTLKKKKEEKKNADENAMRVTRFAPELPTWFELNVAMNSHFELSTYGRRPSL